MFPSIERHVRVREIYTPTCVGVQVAIFNDFIVHRSVDDDIDDDKQFSVFIWSNSPFYPLWRFFFLQKAHFALRATEISE